MFKLFLNTFLTGFFHELITAKKGQSVLGGHATIIDVQDHTVTTMVDIKDNSHYKVTIERINPPVTAEA